MVFVYKVLYLLLLNLKIFFILNRHIRMLSFSSLFFCFLILVITVILPHSNIGEVVQTGWSDQRLFLNSLQQVLAGNSPTAVKLGLIGPGYTALGLIFTKILGINPTYALVVLNRLSFVLTPLVFFKTSEFVSHKYILLINNFSSNKTFLINYPHRFVIFIYTLTIIFSSNFVSFSDIPWTHFVATFLILVSVGLTIVLFEEEKHSIKINKYLLSSILGFSSALLLQVRFFEGVIYFFSLLLWLLLKLIIKISHKSYRQSLLINFIKLSLPALLFFIATCYLTITLSNVKEFNMLYLTLAEKDPFVREYTRIYLNDFPLKFIQLFIDTNFFTKGQDYDIQPLIFGFEPTNSWKMPLLLQIPAMLYMFPATFFLLGILIATKKMLRVFDIEIFLPLTTSILLVVLYVSAAASGSPHLKYGFVRDFMAPTWLLGLITGPWIFNYFLYLKFQDLKKQILLILPIVPILICILYGQILIKSFSFPKFDNVHVNTIKLTNNCQKSKCNFDLDMYNLKGKIVKAPMQKYIISATCTKTGEQKVMTLSSQNQDVQLPLCNDSYPVNIFVVQMGFAGTPETSASWLLKPIKS